MPVPSGTHVPKPEVKPPVADDVYNVKVDDIEEEIKPSTFKNDDGSAKPDTHQYKIKMSVTDPGEFNGRWITAWVMASLVPPAKSKKVTLAQFLKAVSGKVFEADQYEEVTGELLNSFIGAPLRVSTLINDSGYATVTSFLASK